MFCADYAFVRDEKDEDLLTSMIGKLYPAKAYFATACDVKGPTDEAVNRLVTFLKETGITKLIYKTDQESALKATIEEALKRTGRSGEFEAFDAVAEYSAVGESASNGRAERAVQVVEDLLRTLKSAPVDEDKFSCAVAAPRPQMAHRAYREHSESILHELRWTDAIRGLARQEVHAQGGGVWGASLL